MIDPIQFLQQTVNFLILLLLLKRFLYEPIRKFMDERTAAIEDNIAQAEADKAEAAELRSELEERLSQGRQEAKEYLDNAMRRSEKMHEELLTDAKSEAEHIKQRAQEDIRREQEQAWAELKDQVVQLSFQIASKVVKDSLDEERHEKLVKDVVRDLDESRLGDRL